MQEEVAEKVRLKIIYGSMYAGKTERLMAILRMRTQYQKVLAVNSVLDNRYGTGALISHSGNRFDAVAVKELHELRSKKEYQEAHAIGIDEGAFFGKELAMFIKTELAVTDKYFVVTSLAGDSDKNLFGHVYELIPHADDGIECIYSVCSRCADGTAGVFNYKRSEEDGDDEQIDVGATDKYEAVCRYHYDLLTGS